MNKPDDGEFLAGGLEGLPISNWGEAAREAPADGYLAFARG